MRQDHDMFERAVMKHRPFVISLLPHYLRYDRQRGDDVVNLIFATAWRKWPEYRPSKGGVLLWLYWIARYVIGQDAAAGVKRKAEFHREVMGSDSTSDDRPDCDMLEQKPDESLTDPCDLLYQEQVKEALQTAIAHLPAADARAVAYLLDGVTIRQAAQTDGISRQAMHERAKRAKQWLHELLDPELVT